MEDKEYLETILSVFRQVRSGFSPITDLEQHKVEDFWQVPADLKHVVGDCDDFAIACRVLLWRYGIKNRLLLCYEPTGVGHLVCTTGQYILDNLQITIRKKSELEWSGYRWICISGYTPGEPWHKVGGKLKQE